MKTAVIRHVKYRRITVFKASFLFQFKIELVYYKTVFLDDSEGEEIDDRPRRKRKRKSRWAPESSKVDPSSIATSPAVNVATPSSIGSVVPIIPQSQQNQSKTLPS